MNSKPITPLKFINQRVLAAELKISQQAVQQWASNGEVPADRVLEVERLTGISRNRLNPKIYPD